jgi:hypothetical protein
MLRTAWVALWQVRKAAEAMSTPPIRFTLDERSGTLYSAQGPMLGRMLKSAHPPEATTTQETFQGITQRVTSQWEDTGDGAPPILCCHTTTVGKEDVADQRSRVELRDAEGACRRLVVETRLTKRPGEPAVMYERTYEPLKT